MRETIIIAALLAPVAGFLAAVHARAAEPPTASPGYSVMVFATAPPGASEPDSLAVVGHTVWVGYGGQGKPDGSGGAVSQIVEYDDSGHLIRNLTVIGHNDGLKLDPATHKLWALQNEDANANMVLITPSTGAMSQPYRFDAATHGGGYDDAAFVAGKVYISASNPSIDNGAKNPGPAIVHAVMRGNHTIAVSPEMPGTPTATNIVTGQAVHLNLTDPDSMTVTPAGDLFLDSQGDGELLWMHPGSTRIDVLPLKNNVQVDDTAFVTSRHGYLLVSDTDGQTVYKITAPSWPEGVAYSASTGVDATATPPTPAVPAYVGRLDLKTGTLTPIAEHMASPHGLIFVGTR